MEFVALLLFILIFILILSGIQVAFVLGGLSVIFGLIFVPDFLDLLPLRIMGTMKNVVLLAVPLFIYMGLMLEKSGLAESMLNTMSRLFGNIRGGLGISVIIVGALLAASTGIVGATVVTMGLISLPTMLYILPTGGVALIDNHGVAFLLFQWQITSAGPPPIEMSEKHFVPIDY